MWGYEDFKKLFIDLTKDRRMKTTIWIIIMIIGLGLTISLIQYFIDGYNGKPARFLFGLLERNIQRNYPDTLVVTKKDTVLIDTCLFKNSNLGDKYNTNVNRPRDVHIGPR